MDMPLVRNAASERVWYDYMGLIKAIGGAIRGTMADQWKEYFYCDSLDADVLVAKGAKRTKGKFGTKNNGNDNIITNGSVIAVNEGQCMIIVDQGKVVEFCGEAGQFLFDTSTEPSLFCGPLGKSELMTALQPAFAEISAMGIRYSAVPAHTTEMAEALNKILSEKWAKLRGIEIVSFGVNSITAPKEDEDMIKNLQRTAVMRNPGMAAATLTEAQAEAMKSAAANTSTGPMMAFAGMNMANQAGGINAGSLFQMQADQAQAAPAASPAANSSSAASAASWTCSCGTVNTGKFCSQCGAPKPAPAVGWTCSCGAVNTGKFCSECGAKKPAGAPLYKCDKCGWEPEDPHHPPKFCPECGDPFDDNDIQ